MKELHFGRAFSDDASEAKDSDLPDETAAPDYSFEGYSVEFLDKVALLPLPDTDPARIGS